MSPMTMVGCMRACYQQGARQASESSHRNASPCATDARRPKPGHWVAMISRAFIRTLVACLVSMASAMAADDPVTSSAVDPRLEACKIHMTTPEKHEWTTWWDPQGVALSGEGPSSAHSVYWASGKEKKNLHATQAAMPLDINCSSEGPPEILVSLAAIASSEKDLPLGPGTYAIVGKSSGEVQPGQFLAGGLTFKKGEYDARSGTLKIDKFDKEGVAGSFVIDGVEALNRARRIRLEGTFEIPCRGGMLETECKANKARAVAAE
jgi:hypothetical protein